MKLKVSKRVLGLYLIYNIGFVIFYLSCISTVSFFHFQLGHDLSVIEEWIDRNIWSLIIFSKAASFLIVLKGHRLNNYQSVGLRGFLKSTRFELNAKFIVAIFFLNVFIKLLLDSLGAFSFNENIERKTFSTFFGNTLFYLLDILLLVIMGVNFKLQFKKSLLTFGLYFCLFLLSTVAVITNIGSLWTIAFIHFFNLLLVSYSFPKDLFSLMVYSLFIGVSASFYGLDIQSYGIVGLRSSMESPFVIIGVTGIWVLFALFIGKNDSYLMKSAQFDEG